MSCTPAPSTVRLWANLPLLVTLKVYVPAVRVLDGRVIVNSDSATAIAVPGAAAVALAEVDGTAVFAGLLLSLLQLARVTAAAMRISPRIGFMLFLSNK